MTLSTLYYSTEKLWRSCIKERQLDCVTNKQTNKQTQNLSVLRLKCTLQKCRLLFAPISGSLNHMEGPQQNVKYMYIVFSPTYIQGFRSLISAKVSMFHCGQKNVFTWDFKSISRSPIGTFPSHHHFAFVSPSLQKFADTRSHPQRNVSNDALFVCTVFS